MRAADQRGVPHSEASPQRHAVRSESTAATDHQCHHSGHVSGAEKGKDSSRFASILKFLLVKLFILERNLCGSSILGATERSQLSRVQSELCSCLSLWDSAGFFQWQQLYYFEKLTKMVHFRNF